MFLLHILFLYMYILHKNIILYEWKDRDRTYDSTLHLTHINIYILCIWNDDDVLEIVIIFVAVVPFILKRKIHFIQRKYKNLYSLIYIFVCMKEEKKKLLK